MEPLRIPRGSLAADAPELALSRLLQTYRTQREARLVAEGASQRQITADRLVITNLQKRLLSSIEAFARTLAVHQRSRERQEASRTVQGDLPRGGVEADSDLAEHSAMAASTASCNRRRRCGATTSFRRIARRTG